MRQFLFPWLKKTFSDNRFKIKYNNHLFHVFQSDWKLLKYKLVDLFFLVWKLRENGILNWIGFWEFCWIDEYNLWVCSFFTLQLSHTSNQFKNSHWSILKLISSFFPFSKICDILNLVKVRKIVIKTYMQDVTSC